MLLKAYFAYLQQNQKFSWLTYSPDPVSDSFRWCVLDQRYAILPLNINIQEKFFRASKLIIKFAEAHKAQLVKRPKLTVFEPISPPPPEPQVQAEQQQRQQQQ